MFKVGDLIEPIENEDGSNIHLREFFSLPLKVHGIDYIYVAFEDSDGKWGGGWDIARFKLYEEPKPVETKEWWNDEQEA